MGAAARPGVQPLRCTAAWLRAQPLFEEWLPMIGFGGADGSHPALGAAAATFVPLAVRGARLELGLEAFEASAELFEVAMPLVQDVAAEGARDTVLPLLQAFMETCAKLPSNAGPGASVGGADLGDVVGVLLTVLHAAYSSTAPIAYQPLRPGLLAMGGKLLALAGPRGGLEMDCEGGLLGRTLDAWEALPLCHRPDEDLADLGVSAGPMVGMPTGPAPPAGAGDNADQSLALAFVQLLESLPLALALPPTLTAVPDDWDLPRLRARTSQLLTVWCDASESRVVAMFAALSGLLSRLTLNGGPLDGKLCADTELVLTFAAAAGEAVASLGDASARGLPPTLAHLLLGLSRLPFAEAPPLWRALLEVAAADLIVAVDPWVMPENFSPASENGRTLLAFVFQLATSPHASPSSAEALAAVVSNLAAQLAASQEMVQEVFGLLRGLCVGGLGPGPQVSGLGGAARERLVRSALGPLLSQLPEVHLCAAVEALAAPLRAAAPPSHAPDAAGVVASRLLFQLLAAPHTESAELPLRWLTDHWAWFEAAVASPEAPEPVVEAACQTLTASLGRARNSPAALEVLGRALPMLSEATTRRGSVAALSTLAGITRVFKGGEADEGAAALFAAHVAGCAQKLLGGAGENVPQLPPDLLATLMELFTIALAPRCRRLSALLLTAPGTLRGVVSPVVAALPSCAQPRTVCWGLLLCERLPPLLEPPELRPSAARLLEDVAPDVVAACCRLLAASPVAQDPEVCSTLARALRSLARALPALTEAALRGSMGPLGIAAEEGDSITIITIIITSSTTTIIISSSSSSSSSSSCIVIVIVIIIIIIVIIIIIITIIVFITIIGGRAAAAAAGRPPLGRGHPRGGPEGRGRALAGRALPEGSGLVTGRGLGGEAA